MTFLLAARSQALQIQQKFHSCAFTAWFGLTFLGSGQVMLAGNNKPTVPKGRYKDN